MKNKGTLLVLLLFTTSCFAQWWKNEPVSIIQTNLRENSEVDPRQLIQQVVGFGANTLLVNVGGILAFYPSDLPFQPVNPKYKNCDLIADLLKEAHENNIRIIGRFDFSLASVRAYQQHPEWFMRDSKGNPVIEENGLYYTCMNGYYRNYAFEILQEALEKYDLDGVFINQFQNRSSDPTGNELLCHCATCKKRYLELFGKQLPEKINSEYNHYRLVFLRQEVAGLFSDIIHTIRPEAAFMTYMNEVVDVVMAESRTYHPFEMPPWRYAASDNVNRVKNLVSDKQVFSFCMPHVESYIRLSSVPGAEIQSRLYQTIANGGAPVLAMSGTFEQEDSTMLLAAKPVFEWHKMYEDFYKGQKNAANVLLFTQKREHTGSNWSSANYRGFFKMLTELHIPFVVSHDLSLLDGTKQFDLVIAPDGISETVLPWLEKGGRLITAGSNPERILKKQTYKLLSGLKGAYLQIKKPELFPGLKGRKVIFIEGDFLELKRDSMAPLVFITPSKYSPPEKIFSNAVQTLYPGLLFESVGKGKYAYLPWDIGELYHRYGSDAHRSLISNLVDMMLPNGRDIYTNAHPSIEITIMEQPENNNVQIHLINNSGNSGMSFFDPIPMEEITFRLSGKYSGAIQLSNSLKLKLTEEKGYTFFTVPSLKNYEVVVLKKL